LKNKKMRTQARAFVVRVHFSPPDKAHTLIGQ
jgi:hypothetical protein